jgi:dTDP-4-amino-4,6-dideoxygalactose transaminase
MIVTNDPRRAEKLTCIRGHGSGPKYHHKIIGGNFRLDAIQAAVVSAKLRHLDDWTAARRRNAQRYDQLFRETGLVASGRVVLPVTAMDRHIFNQYVIRVADRDALQSSLKANGVGTEVYYPVPMHLQECFAYLGHQPGEFPESERAAAETLALPIQPELIDAQGRYVVDCINAFVSRHPSALPCGERAHITAVSASGTAH